jgi:hypothetical protein
MGIGTSAARELAALRRHRRGGRPKADAWRRVCIVGISRDALASVRRKIEDVLYGR